MSAAKRRLVECVMRMSEFNVEKMQSVADTLAQMDAVQPRRRRADDDGGDRLPFDC